MGNGVGRASFCEREANASESGGSPQRTSEKGYTMEFELRPLSESDAESIAMHANNKKIADNLTNAFPHPYAIGDARAFISDCIKKEGNKQLIRAIIVDGEAAGTIGVFVKDDIHERSAELGYWLSEKFWGSGIVTEAAKRMTALAFETFDIIRIYAEPFEYNTGSKRVLEKAGFALEGVLRKSVAKNGKTFDSCIYALTKEE